MDGVITRLFYYADGTVYTNYGELTEKEHAMNMLDIGGLSPDDAVSAIYENMEKEDELETKLLAEGKSRAEVEKQVADKIKLSPTHDEDLHFSLAEAWSISPDNLDQRGLAESVGVIGKLPKAVLG